jgi:hypothetical protein
MLLHLFFLVLFISHFCFCMFNPDNPVLSRDYLSYEDSCSLARSAFLAKVSGLLSKLAGCFIPAKHHIEKYSLRFDCESTINVVRYRYRYRWPRV